MKSCMEKIGFSESCAEVWAYNGKNTGEMCPLECIKTYGLIDLILGKESAPTTNADGELNECLLCDEMMSGPGEMDLAKSLVFSSEHTQLNLLAGGKELEATDLLFGRFEALSM